MAPPTKESIFLTIIVNLFLGIYCLSASGAEGQCATDPAGKMTVKAWLIVGGAIDVLLATAWCIVIWFLGMEVNVRQMVETSNKWISRSVGFSFWVMAWILVFKHKNRRCLADGDSSMIALFVMWLLNTLGYTGAFIQWQVVNALEEYEEEKKEKAASTNV